MTTDIKKEFEKLITDFAQNIYFEGDPKRTNGTTPADLLAFLESKISQAVQEERERIVGQIPELVDDIWHFRELDEIDDGDNVCRNWVKDDLVCHLGGDKEL